MKINKTSRFEFSKRVLGVMIALGFTWQALATGRDLTEYKTLSMDQAQELVEKLDTTIPIDMNEKVLKWLNFFISTPKGKAYMIKSYERMHNYKKFLTEKLQKAKMPTELLAVPFMESGFKNTHVSSMQAAGIWQFTPGTARRYGLKVNKHEDERINVDKLTNTAIAYYRDLLAIEEFAGDWRLALIAYNAGESRLVRHIKKLGTRNPWALDHIGDKDYLAKIIAGIILLKNPDNKILARPLHSGRRTSGFGRRLSLNKKKRVFHSGVDLAAKLGTPILAPLPGVVTKASFIPGYGKSLIIDHGNNIETRYHHLNDYFVKTDEKVEGQQKIATVGSTGISTGPHLHFEILINGKNVDPEIFF